MKRVYFCATALLLMLIACDISLNSSPPDYLKRFTAYKEGNGIVVYFILADSSGKMTTSDGRATLSLSAHLYGQEREIDIYVWEYKFSRKDFIKTRIGRGSFEQEVILYSMGRISFEAFEKLFEDLKRDNWTGKLRLKIKTTQKDFKAEDTYYF